MSAGKNALAAQSFGLRVQKRAKIMIEQRREIFERFAILIALNLILGGEYSPGTPIALGFAQNSWVVGVGGMGTFRQPANREGAEREVPVAVVSFDEAVAQLSGIQLGAVVRFSSNCIYIRVLEFGHSGQAPSGFLRITIAAANRIAKDAGAQEKAAASAARELMALRRGSPT